MVLFVIGILVTLYFIREIIRLWHEHDSVLWVPPLNRESDPDMEEEKKLMEDIHASNQLASTDRQPPQSEPIGTTGVTLVDSTYEFQTAKLISTLPREVRNMLLTEAEKIEKMRRHSNSLTDFIASIEALAPPPAPAPAAPASTESKPAPDQKNEASPKTGP